MQEKINYNTLFLGFFIGVILAIGIFWYLNHNKKGDDWWCSYLSTQENEYCRNLYLKFQSIIDKMGKDDQSCISDYMGGCN